MDALARPVERRAFEMETEHAGNLQASLSDCSQLVDHLASVGDQGWQAARGASEAMRFNDASYPCLGWLVIEKNTAAPIDLNVYESGRKDHIFRQLCCCARRLLSGADALDTAVRNPDRGRPAHGRSIEEQRRSDCEGGSKMTHREHHGLVKGAAYTGCIAFTERFKR